MQFHQKNKLFNLLLPNEEFYKINEYDCYIPLRYEYKIIISDKEILSNYQLLNNIIIP